MKIRMIISADEGKVLTDGKSYLREISLSEDESVDSFYEISEAEYERILAEQEAKEI